MCCGLAKVARALVSNNTLHEHIQYPLHCAARYCTWLTANWFIYGGGVVCPISRLKGTTVLMLERRYSSETGSLGVRYYNCTVVVGSIYRRLICNTLYSLIANLLPRNLHTLSEKHISEEVYHHTEQCKFNFCLIASTEKNHGLYKCCHRLAQLTHILIISKNRKVYCLSLIHI